MKTSFRGFVIALVMFANILAIADISEACGRRRCRRSRCARSCHYVCQPVHYNNCGGGCGGCSGGQMHYEQSAPPAPRMDQNNENPPAPPSASRGIQRLPARVAS
jgi:hypothetical protein